MHSPLAAWRSRHEANAKPQAAKGSVPASERGPLEVDPLFLDRFQLSFRDAELFRDDLARLSHAEASILSFNQGEEDFLPPIFGQIVEDVAPRHRDSFADALHEGSRLQAASVIVCRLGRFANPFLFAQRGRKNEPAPRTAGPCT